jgi:hypothetical protein
MTKLASPERFPPSVGENFVRKYRHRSNGAMPLDSGEGASHAARAALAGVDGSEVAGRVHRQEAVDGPYADEARRAAESQPLGQDRPME